MEATGDKPPCKACNWKEAPHMHAIAHVGFYSYCNRCHDKIIKESKQAYKERQRLLAAEQENK